MGPDTVVALCPYCGGEMKETRTCCSENKTTYCTECNSTGPEGPPLHFDTCEAFDAIAPCNTRPIEDALRAEIERLTVAIAHAIEVLSNPLGNRPAVATFLRCTLAYELDNHGGE